MKTTNYEDVWVRLVHRTTGEAVKVGDVVTDFRGDKATVTGGRAPQKPSSTGRIYTKRSAEQQYSTESFPSVYDCEWRTV